ncbi:DUF4333 domain-containing protein [Gulosibacter sp. 10]|uniref:DUF4333 domain-containing protein n=1 Tax=Gulosibacter sp. 10 TaxID=1255570 RepID=UPI00097F0639|nr:DUF4333 domain-containing protein [Gulosibacter sp. 10]SJM58221.1 hypothetical protein FM112_05745 [Gulosibacter sp. 10]
MKKLAVLLGAVALALVGCSSSVSADDLADEVKSALTEQVGIEPDSVECPDPLPAEEGSEVRCTLTHEGTSFGVTVTSKGETDGNIEFDIQVDETPEG